MVAVVLHTIGHAPEASTAAAHLVQDALCVALQELKELPPLRRLQARTRAGAHMTKMLKSARVRTALSWGHCKPADAGKAAHGTTDSMKAPLQDRQELYQCQAGPAA